MNRIFRTLWSHSLQAWVVTSELAKSCGKRGGGRAAGLLLLAPLGAMAADLPIGGTVVSGSGQLSSSGRQLTVEQSSANLAIDWQSFDIGAGHGVTFHQPSSQAVALNRVVGQDASRILGNLDANGRVFLVNPNGILFGQGASVNVGGLVASTLDISNSDFEQGRYHFKSQATPRAVINQGRIQAHDGGAVALLGGQVSNQGVIIAKGGSVALAAGQAMTLDFAGDGLLSVKVDEATADALAENRELIQANGGQVLLTAHASDALLKTVVNNSGVIEAQTLAERGGKIELLGGFNGGTVQVAGTLDASAPNGGDGGFIETSGAHIQVADGARITSKAPQGKSGTWLIDPEDLTVDSAAASTISGALNGGTNVTLLASLTNASGPGNVSNGSGDINVNAAIGWSGNATLTLDAYHSIRLNAAVTATGDSAGLVLNYGGYTDNGTVGGTGDYYVNTAVSLGGAHASLAINGQAYRLIHSLSDAGRYFSTPGYYALAQDIDLGGVTRSGALVSSFQSTLAGMGHSLNNLTISGGSGYVGLFGTTSSNSLVRDLHLGNVSISGGYYVGGLVGYGQGAIKNVTVDGTVTGTSGGVGGLAGYNLGLIDNGAFNGSVSGSSSVGGLVGNNVGAPIRNSHSSGSVTGSSSNTGGLVGYNDGGSVTNAYSTSNVSGTSSVGGLVGASQNAGTIKNSYASGSVIGTNSGVGGLVGMNYQSTIANTYATGSVTAPSSVGGLVGVNNPGGAAVTSASVGNSYATGAVNGTTNVGGLIGANMGSVSNGSWDVNSTGQANAASGGGGSFTNLTSFGSGNRYNHATYGNLGTWSLVTGTNDVYVANDGLGNPAWIMIEGQTRPFLASEYSTRIGNAHQLQLMAYNLAANYSLSGYLDASQTAGSTASGMWSSAGFSPVGNDTHAFTGSLDGQDRTIDGLTIARNSQSYVGLFGNTSAYSRISDLALTGASIAGYSYVGGVVGFNNSTLSGIDVAGSVAGTGNFIGGLAGYNNARAISDATTTGSVVGSGGPYSGNYVGGLVGSNDNGTVNDALSSSTVSGGSNVGGLVGSDYLGRYNNVTANGSATSTSAVSGDHVGGLIGNANQSQLQNALASGDVTATTSYAGGLLGQASSVTLSNVQASGNVSGSTYVGGLIGLASRGTVTNAFATGSLSGASYVGGLVGKLFSTSLSDAYATGDVSGTSYIGGLAGYNDSGVLARVYATGFIAGTDFAGGLVGYNEAGSITAAYATGGVIGTEYLGGLVGYNEGGTINASYSTGDVGGNNAVGGLVGANDNGTINASFFATDISGNPINGGLNLAGSNTGSIDAISGGRSWAALNTLSTFTAAGWSIDDKGGTGEVWRLYEGMNTPLLRSFLTPLIVTTSLSGLDKTYDGSGVSGTTASYTLDNSTDPSLLVGSSLHYATTGNGAAHYTVGNGNLLINGLASSQQGYDIIYVDTGGITINRKTLTGSITAQDKTYDGTTAATTHGTLDGVIAGDNVTLATSGSFTDKNAGNGKQVNVSGALSGTGAGNYVLGSSNATTTATITPKSLTGSITAQDKVYDGTTSATTSGTLSGVIGGDAVDFTTSGSFVDKNAGSARQVNVSGVLSGTDAGNYLLGSSTNATTTASITPKTLTSSITAENKTYDGITAATTHGTLDGVIAGDNVTLASSGSFADKNAGNGKTVNTTGSLGGADAGNYLLTANATTTADITPASLVITAEDASKVAGQSALLQDYSVTGLLTGDAVAQVTLASPGANAAAAPGSYLIEPSAASGLGLGNYLISYRTGTLTVQDLAVLQPLPGSPSTLPPNTPPLVAARVSSTTLALQEGQTSTAQTSSNSSLRLPPMDLPSGSFSLSSLPSLEVVNRGIRLPEGI